MAKRQTDLEADFEKIVTNWVAVNRTEDSDAWSAWIHWRAENMQSVIQPDNLTVPSMYPPTTIAAVKEYFEALKMSRRIIGWPKGIDRLSKNPSAWMGGNAK